MRLKKFIMWCAAGAG